MVWSNQAPTSITFPPGATSGERIVIDQSGIKAYGTDNVLYFSLDADNPFNSFIILPPEAGTTARIIFNHDGLVGFTEINNEFFNISTGPTLQDNSKIIFPPSAAGLVQEQIQFDKNGITMYDNALRIVTQLGLAFFNTESVGLLPDTGGSNPSGSIAGGTYLTAGSGMTLNGNGGAIVIGNSGDSIQFTKGPIGNYYSQRATVFGQNLPNSTWTDISPTAFTNTYIDYPNAWAGGVFTCPAAGPWDFTVGVTNLATGGAITYGIRILINGSSLYGDVWNGTALIQPRTLSINGEILNIGDTVEFQAFQASGAAANINARINASRRL